MTRNTRVLIAAPLLFVLGVVLTLACAALTGIPVAPLRSLAPVVFIAAAFLAVIAAAIAGSKSQATPSADGCKREAATRSPLGCSPSGWRCVVVCFLNIDYAFMNMEAYGDYECFRLFLDEGRVMPKWLLGHVVVQFLYGLVRNLPPFFRALIPMFESSISFSKWLGALTMGAATVMLVKRWPNRTSLLFVIFTPAWLAFSSGYLEYYPFIAWIIPALYLWLLDKPLGDRNPYVVGALAAALPLVYMGFAPLAVFVLLFHLIERPKNAAKLVGAFLVSLYLLIRVFYADFPHKFLGEYAYSMAPGDLFTGFERYKGKAASASSVFFETGYALSGEHLKDVFYILFFGGGFAAPIILLYNGGMAAIRGAVNRNALKSPRLWLGVVLVAWAAYFLVFMIPKFGPRNDVDLFFIQYITFSFFAGHLLDRRIENRPNASALRLCWFAAFLGNSAVVTAYLMLIGIPYSLF